MHTVDNDINVVSLWNTEHGCVIMEHGTRCVIMEHGTRCVIMEHGTRVCHYGTRNTGVSLWNTEHGVSASCHTVRPLSLWMDINWLYISCCRRRMERAAIRRLAVLGTADGRRPRLQ